MNRDVSKATRLARGIGAVPLLCLAPTAAAGLEGTASISDPASLISGLASHTVESFDDSPVGDFPDFSSQTFNGFSSLPSGGQTPSSSSYGIVQTSPGDGVLNMILDQQAEPPFDGYSTLTLEFDSAVDVVGFHFTEIFSDEGVIVAPDLMSGPFFDLSGGVPDGLSGENGSFLVFEFSEPITELKLLAGDQFAHFQLDTVITGIVPTPATSMGFLIGSLFAVNRRRQS